MQSIIVYYYQFLVIRARTTEYINDATQNSLDDIKRKQDADIRVVIYLNPKINELGVFINKEIKQVLNFFLQKELLPSNLISGIIETLYHAYRGNIPQYLLQTLYSQQIPFRILRPEDEAATIAAFWRGLEDTLLTFKDIVKHIDNHDKIRFAQERSTYPVERARFTSGYGSR